MPKSWLAEAAGSGAIQDLPPVSVFHEELVTTAGLIALSFFILLALLAIQQECERNAFSRRVEILLAGVFSNMMGLGLMFAIVLVVQRPG